MKQLLLYSIVASVVWPGGACGQSSEVPATQIVAKEKQEEPLSLAEFESHLKQYSDQLAQLAQNPAAAGEIRKSLPEQWSVKVDTATAKVPSDELRQSLAELQRGGDAGQSGLQKAKEWLDRTTLAAQQLSAGSRPVGADRARQELAKVYARSEFRGLNGPGVFDQWLARAERWIEKQMERILRSIHVPPRFGRVLIWPVLALALGVLAYLVWRLLRDSTATPIPQFDTETPEIDPAWLKEALAMAERGEYREAVHLGYWAAITRLEHRQLLKRDRTRTPRESLRQLESHPAERGILREQTVRLERIWYGCREATPNDWTNALSELREIGCL